MIQRARSETRTGIAAVEMALLLPFLLFILVITLDFARVFYYTSVIASSARDGALYGCMDSTRAQDTSGIQSAALAENSLVSMTTSNVSSSYGTDDGFGNPYVKVTITYSFKTVVSYPGIPSTVSLSRSEQMRVSQTVPN